MTPLTRAPEFHTELTRVFNPISSSRWHNARSGIPAGRYNAYYHPNWTMGLCLDEAVVLRVVYKPVEHCRQCRRG